jgi:hypothetical protein
MSRIPVSVITLISHNSLLIFSPQARILYVDPQTKQAGLSLLPHLQSLTLPSPTPMLGQLFDGNAKVKRVFVGLGLLLELPMGSQQGGGEETRCAGRRDRGR